MMGGLGMQKERRKAMTPGKLHTDINPKNKLTVRNGMAYRRIITCYIFMISGGCNGRT